MRNVFWKAVLVCLGIAGAVGLASGATIVVNSDITTSTTWTADNTYDLQTQIFVMNSATLTIEAGTVIASTPTVNGSGSLAVAKGSRIYVQGTRCNPVIMTSLNDVATWDIDASHPTGRDPKTGTWREAANEWGNLTIMGDGYISEDVTPGNVVYPHPSNYAAMEGLVVNPSFPTRTFYGGGNDFDNSGSISYLSIRYGGRVVGLANELNGLSLGGIGKDTDINHVEIMNNVDDGIEIWGGCVNLKYVSIWNIGDDSFDIDQGWRGQAQFGLIVQGYSLDASQGSGVGDNCFEHDGAENSDYQPVTTTSLYNFTVIGQPLHGDGATTWRDNARVQYHNCIFMDCGEKVVRFDNIDGDGAQGYGHNGTLSWADTWTTAYDMVPAHPNDPPAPPANFCNDAQSSGYLAEITDSVFFRNQNADAYTEANNVGVFNPANNNVQVVSILDADAPVQTLTRGALVVKGGKNMLPVTFLDPRPKNEALTSVGYAPDNGFYSQAMYRGGFAPERNWLSCWSASEAYGFTPNDDTSFWTDGNTVLSAADGGQVPMQLNAGVDNANRRFLILASLKGSTPGIVLPGGTTTVPVRWDGFTDYVLIRLNGPLFQNFLALLDGDGNGNALLNIPGVNPNKIGKTMTYAYCLEGTPDWDFASNPVNITFVP